MRHISALLLLAAFATGCHNPCQDICVRMADYAEECGFSVPPEQVDACLDAQKGSAAKAEFGACREYNDAQTLRNEWTCEEMEQYWGPPAPQ